MSVEPFMTSGEFVNFRGTIHLLLSFSLAALLHMEFLLFGRYLHSMHACMWECDCIYDIQTLAYTVLLHAVWLWIMWSTKYVSVSFCFVSFLCYRKYWFAWFDKLLDEMYWDNCTVNFLAETRTLDSLETFILRTNSIMQELQALTKSKVGFLLKSFH